MAEGTKLILIAIGLIIAIMLTLAFYVFGMRWVFRRVCERYWVLFTGVLAGLTTLTICGALYYLVYNLSKLSILP